MDRYNLQNRIKWRNIDFYKNIELLDKNIYDRFIKVLFNGNNNEDNNNDNNNKLNLSGLFVCFFLYF